MTLKDILTGKATQNSLDRKVFSLLATFLVIIALFVIAGFLFPTAVSIILNIFWMVLLTSAVIFFGLGILVILGMRKEVSRILDILLEGSLTFIDFLDFLRSLWHKFLQLLREFLIFAAPIFSYIIAGLIYVLLLIIYKTVGKSNDVTILTIVITVVAIALFGIISKPEPNAAEPTKFAQIFFKRFKNGLVDSSEVILFVFFLTMDSTNLFFLPANLNVVLHAKIYGYDLMQRSFVYDHNIWTTLNLIVTTVTIEILRNIIRIFALARRYYLDQSREFGYEDKHGTLYLIKEAIRQSFNESKNDLIKFVTFNTVLFAVFLLFPRLKILTLAVASATNLILDIAIMSRLTASKGQDLISRSLAKLFKL